MKYHIDTIPLWDALHQGGECPLCALRRKWERILVDRSLGGSVMEPDARKRVNAKGFCRRHQKMLYDRENRLGHALLMLSRLQVLRQELDPLLAPSPSGESKKRLPFFQKAKGSAGSAALIKALRLNSESCLVCEDLEDLMRRYTDALVNLWKKDPAFSQALASSHGFCLRDTALIIAAAEKQLSQTDFELFTETLKALCLKSLEKLEQDLSWFTQKFDYRNLDKPWSDGKDALERTITRLSGWCVGDEPMSES